MSKLLVMTDLHLTPGTERIAGRDPLEWFQGGLAHAARHHPDADRLILTGDLTDHGDAESYEKLGDALTDVPWPVSFLLGNHDKRDTFRAAFHDCPTDPNGFVQSTVDLGNVRAIMLDSLDEDGATVQDAGHLSEDRLQWLSAQLREAGETPCLLFLHHPPMKIGYTAMDGIRLLNEDAFWDAVRTGPVTHVFAGHVHRNLTAITHGKPVTLFKSVCFQIQMMLGADGFGQPTDDSGGYGIVLTDGPNTTVHFEDFGQAS
ncbi:MAG: phosphodiesterase [Pseudomonadota bacterium]